MAERMSDIKRGTVIYDLHGPAKVLGVIDGYAMVRRKGSAPFLVYAKDIDSKRYMRWTTTPKESPL